MNEMASVLSFAWISAVSPKEKLVQVLLHCATRDDRKKTRRRLSKRKTLPTKESGNALGIKAKRGA